MGMLSKEFKFSDRSFRNRVVASIFGSADVEKNSVVLKGWSQFVLQQGDHPMVAY